MKCARHTTRPRLRRVAGSCPSRRTPRTARGRRASGPGTTRRSRSGERRRRETEHGSRNGGGTAGGRKGGSGGGGGGERRVHNVLGGLVSGGIAFRADVTAGPPAE